MTNWSRLYLATSWKSTCKTSAVSAQRLYIAVLYTYYQLLARRM